MNKKILIIGAGFLQTFVIQKAKELGYFVLALDGDENAPGFRYCDEYAVISIVDEKKCLNYAKQKNISGVMTAATDYGVLTASYIAKEMGLRGIKYDVAKIIKNKYKVRQLLYSNNVDDTSQSYEIDALTDVNNLNLQYPVMVKPCDGSGSRGASRVDKQDDIKDACVLAMDNSITNKAIIESFIVGHEFGVESLVYDGNVHVMGIMKKWMTKPPFYAELGHAIPSGLSHDLELKIKSVVSKAINVLDIDFGAVNMDILVTEKESIHIVDIGARMGGNLIGSHIIKYGTGVDYLANLIKVTIGDKPDFSKNNQCSAVVSRLLALDKGIIEFIPDISTIANEFDVEIYHRLEIGKEINTYHTNLDGMGYIISRDDNQEECIRKAEKVLDILNKSIQRS